MEPILLGYFPKRRTPVPPDYPLPGVEEIASVSECIAPAPQDWIQRWEHNDLFYFDSPAKARAIAPPDQSNAFDIYAYQQFPSGDSTLDIKSSADPLPPSFERLGYDVVSREYSATFECSPLS